MTMTAQPTDAGMTALLGRFQTDIYGQLAAGAAASATPDPADGAMAGLSLAGKIEMHLGQLSREYAADRQRARLQLARRLRGIAPVWLPPIAYQVTGGVPKLSGDRASSADFAPQDGYVWFLTHLVVAGLAGATPGSANAVGTATNPPAATAIASISAAALDAIAPAGGTWQISWTASLQGTIAAGDQNNMRLTSPLNTALELGVFPALAGNYPQGTIVFNRPAGQGINVQSIGAASGAAAVYGAQIVATLVNGNGDTVTLSKVSGTGLNNVIRQFTAAQPDWALSSSSAFLLPDDYLVLSGAGLQATQIVLQGQAVQVEQALLADYLM